MKSYLWISIGIIVISINIAQSFTAISSYRSIYVYDLIKNTQWPEDKNQGTFVIGVMGDSTIVNEFKDLSAKRKAGARRIIINKLSTLKGIENCNIVYISQKNSAQVKRATALVKNQGILVVTEAPGMLQKGASINFVSKEGKLKYEINKNAALQAKLTFSDQLLENQNRLN
ncbi:MAG TPA: YfiR family protein [Cytophagales bacterium]|nr:YfiR family protein [Cytophagales bacterium]